jgi:hypothetical protein
VIPSSELSYALPGEPDGHLLAFGIDVDPLDFVRTRPDLAEAAAWVGEHDGVAYLAHPYWTGMPASGLSLSDGVAGIEVYNACCELEVGRGLSTVHWDELLEQGRGCFGIAADDSHHAERDSGFAWVWTRVTERSAAAVLDALVSGRFYSSMGPRLEGLRVDEARVEVTCSPCRRVTLCTGRKRGASVSSGTSGYRYGGEILAESDDGEITHARLDRPPESPYGRLEVVDRYGRKAWTNPLWD